MTADDVRRLLLQQRKLFGSQQSLARAIGVSEQALSTFINNRHASPRSDSLILAALGLTVEAKMVWVHRIKPKVEL